MATISTRYLTTIAGENQRLIDTAKNLWQSASTLDDPPAVAQIEEQIKRLLEISSNISAALEQAQ
jgi:hypothetical protein